MEFAHLLRRATCHKTGFRHDAFCNTVPCHASLKKGHSDLQHLNFQCLPHEQAHFLNSTGLVQSSGSKPMASPHLYLTRRRVLDGTISLCISCWFPVQRRATVILLRSYRFRPSHDALNRLRLQSVSSRLLLRPSSTSKYLTFGMT